MKNNIIFKFIAIILCAASLLGAIGGMAGVAALSSADLYNKTVPQMLEDRVRLESAQYANELALMYASSALGGAPENLVQEVFYTGSWFESSYGNFGYSILDAEGNTLSNHNPELKENPSDSISTQSFTVTGQYIHLVSEEPLAEAQARVDEKYRPDQSADGLWADIDGDTVPLEGILIDNVAFTRADGRVIYEARYDGYGVNSTYWEEDGSSGYGEPSRWVGFLFYNPQGQLVYRSMLSEYLDFQPTEVYGLHFMNEDRGFMFQTQNEAGLGILYSETVSDYKDGAICFVSHPQLPEQTQAAQAEATEAPETAPEMTEETTAASTEATVPATIPATIPAETAVITDAFGNPLAATEPSVQMPAAAPAETVPSLASAVPGETWVEDLTQETVISVETMPPETFPAETAAPETLPPETFPVETLPEETVPEVTEPVLINGKTLDNYQINTAEYYNGTETMQAKYVYVPMPEMTVEVYVDMDSERNIASYALLDLLREDRDYLLPGIGICLLVFAVFAVYLCTAAGRKPKTTEVKAGGLNCIPLDLYLFGGAFCIAACISYGAEALIYLIRQDMLVGFATAAGLFFLASLIFVGFCFAFVAQIKTPGGYWWRNSLCGICIRLFMRFAMWLEDFLSGKGFPWLGKALRRLWDLTIKATLWCFHAFEKAALWLISRTGSLFRWMGRKINRFASLLPMTWQWLVMGLIMILFALLVSVRNIFFILMGIFVPLAIVLYAAHCFGVLHDSTKRMSKGDLDTKVDDKMLVGCFDDFAGDLNALADVAVVAAQKQLKSERMKTELITNVSHDIKTPLTSIINYVDLLQKPHTEEEGEQYLEVLDRQSQRLKKLIDDLMDMSKASTGNMTVEITKVDAVESVNQALGEFADKLDRARLIPVFRHDEDQVPMMADGKLVWRVLSNLLGNAVKYAMPGTRLYVDLMTLEGKVILSLKNISREELNVDADELMERFVRGDDSRNTEGSGLGLNIAKSLMELQKGQLQILVDGDLFKVTLIFPGI
ncbi:MAG: hypothetical protein IJO21_05545 [Oscillospiraceae bacterium]|nr:hypothetical protein [Oscillospiraceae bacterium]MBQ7130488.1 hypothetical protein [Oscillospiraceae bacterium]